MIRRLYMDNYKTLVNFELKLDSLTLFIGRNGAGKTSVLTVLSAIRQLLSGRAKVSDRGIFPPETRTRWQDVLVQIIELDVDLGEDTLVYRLEIEHDSQGRKTRISRESLAANGQPLFLFSGGEVRLYRDDHSEGPPYHRDWEYSALAEVRATDVNKRLTRFLDFAQKMIVCAINPAGIDNEARSEEQNLAHDGKNFVAWYWNMLLEQPERQISYLDALKDIIFNFKSLKLEKVGREARELVVSIEENNNKYPMGFGEISDGERALIVLYALIHLTADQGYSLFIDEPTSYIALREIQPWLMEIEQACDTTLQQAVLCSHSTELINYLGNDHGILLYRESTGITRAVPVADAVDHDDTLELAEIIARGWE